MSQIFNIALKDLKILSRDPVGMFFILGFPVLMGLFFGLMMSGMNSSGGSASKMKVALVDNDKTESSKQFIELLNDGGNIELMPGELEESKENVRKGRAVGVLVLKERFGERVGVFWGEPPEIQLGLDPSRGAESAMLQGYIMQAIGSMTGQRFADPSQFHSSIDIAKDQAKADESLNPINRQLMLGFLGSVDSMLDSVSNLQNNQEGGKGETIGQPGFEFANITELDISRQVDPKSPEGQIKKITSQWDVSFPQAMLWGILGCIAGFSTSIAREQSSGTMTRLQIAPIAKHKILAGKALACFLAVLFVIAMMTVLGYFLSMRPGNLLHLCIAALSVAFCFVGIMMTLSLLGKTEQSVNGLGWMANMIMAMLGGCMIPVMFMPGFIKQFSMLSPVRWAISAIEGAIWRDYTLAEMLVACGILIGIGTVGMIVGSVILGRRLS